VILLRLISWPYLRKHALRTMLTTMGVVLGVSVFVGMHAANQSVLFAFSQTIDRIAGKTELQVTAGESGFGEDVLDKVQSAATVRAAEPVIEAIVEANIPGEGNLLVVGVDMTGDRSVRDYDIQSEQDDLVDDPLVFLAQPDSLIISKEFADRHSMAVGGRLPLGTAEGERTFTIRGIVKTSGLASAFGGSLALMDVYAAQKMFGRGRTFDRIDVVAKPGTTASDCQRELAALLGAGFDIQPPAVRGQQAAAMLAGYTMMVNISSVFALFIALFIIYNAFAVAVTERRSEIGILRALGATTGQIRRLFLGESVVMGLVGSLVGLGLGVLLARAVASAISGLIGNVYGVAQRWTEIAVSPMLLALALVVGIATSVIAAVIPARHAARVYPVEALKKGGSQTFSVAASRLRLKVAAVLGPISVACLILGDSRPIFYVGYTFALVVAVLLEPLLSWGLAKALRPALKRLRPVEGTLAADSLVQAPRRTSASVAGLMLSLAVVMAFSGMARASYSSILDWLNTTLNADLFVMPSQRLDLRTTRFPATMATEIAGVPGVGRVQLFRNGRVTFRGAPAMLVAVEMTSIAQTMRHQPIAGDATEMFRKAAAGEGLLISDSLAQLRHLSLGDVVDVAAPRGAIQLPVVGVILDFTDQSGAIFVDRSVFIKYWNDDSVSDFRVFVAPGADVGDVRQRIIERFAGRRQVFVLTHEGARSYILRLTDQWFSLINVQIAIAVLVAILGIVNALSVSIMDRRRELAVLRAVGAWHGQIRRTIRIEALAIATIGLVLGFALGAINLHYMLGMVRRDVAGLRLDYQFPVATAAALVPIMWVVAFAAAIWPAEAAVRGSLVEALEYE